MHGAVEGQVGHAGFRMVREQDARRDVGAGVFLEIGDVRQVGERNPAAVGGRFLQFRTLRRARQQPVPGRAEGKVRRPDQGAQPPPAAIDVADDGHRRAAHIFEQDGAVMPLLECRRDRRQLVLRIDFTPDDMQVAGGSQTVQIGAHGAILRAGPGTP